MGTLIRDNRNREKKKVSNIVHRTDCALSKFSEMTKGNGTPVLVSWSGGKDSCLALQELMNGPDYQVTGLLTTITRDFDRISMHGVRTALLREQAEKLGLPLHEVFISKSATNAEYEGRMAEAFAACRARGI